MGEQYDAKSIATMLDNIPTQKSFETLLDQVAGIDKKLADLGKPPEVAVVEDPEKADLEKGGFFDDIIGFEWQGIPVGQAAVGGFAAILASELVDGFMASSEAWKRGLVKLGVAAVSAKWGKRLLGGAGSKAVALLLTFDAIRDLSPINSWADQLAEKITGTVTSAGLAGDTGNHKVDKQPANPGAMNYYATMFGG